MKQCAKCGVIKPLDQYNKSRKEKDGHVSRCKSCRREDRLADRDNIKERTKRWNDLHREYTRTRQREYYQRNKPSHRAREQARRRNVENPDNDTLAYMGELRRDRCPYCGGPGGTVDHVVSVKDGGDNTRFNMTGSCQSCNSSKGAKPLLQWLVGRTIK